MGLWVCVFLFQDGGHSLTSGVRWRCDQLNWAWLVLPGNRSKKLMSVGPPFFLSVEEMGWEGMERSNWDGRESGAVSCVTVSVLD